jgi:hypothetical protein
MNIAGRGWPMEAGGYQSQGHADTTVTRYSIRYTEKKSI